MVFCNVATVNQSHLWIKVTILILIDGFLQYKQKTFKKEDKMSQSLF